MQSQTQQDAIAVCRALNIQYLWVDGLCIVQNDDRNRDWNEESGKMRQIYSNALLSIAADMSKDCTQGFLGRQTMRPQIFYHNRNGGQLHVTGFRGPFKVFTHEDCNAILNSPLQKRAWALQEGLLPKRILHFSEEEMVWECNERCACECGASNYHFLRMSTRGIQRFVSYPQLHDGTDSRTRKFIAWDSIGSTYWAWQSLVCNYTPRALTQSCDKLIALSGLAQSLSDAYSSEAGRYLAGLWEGNMLHDLLWYVRDERSTRQGFEYRAPSWSWASIEGGVEYFKESHQFLFEPAVTILNAECSLGASDATGQVKSGSITLEGYLEPVRLYVKSHDPSLGTEHSCRYRAVSGLSLHSYMDQIVLISGLQSKEEHEILPDERLDLGVYEQNYFCLEVGTHHEVGTRKKQGERGFRIWYLILKQINHGETIAYRRIGLCYVQRGTTWRICEDWSWYRTITLI